MFPPILFRHISPDDKGRLAAGLRRLSPQTQQRRFLMPKPRFSSSELRYLTEIDGFDHVAIVAVSAEDPEVFYAVGRFVRLRDDPETAEVAIVVGDALQGKGLGTALARRLVDEARERGVKRFTAALLGDNVAARRLFERMTTLLEDRVEGGRHEVVGVLAA